MIDAFVNRYWLHNRFYNWFSDWLNNRFNNRFNSLNYRFYDGFHNGFNGFFNNGLHNLFYDLFQDLFHNLFHNWLNNLLLYNWCYNLLNNWFNDWLHNFNRFDMRDCNIFNRLSLYLILLNNLLHNRFNILLDLNNWLNQINNLFSKLQRHLFSRLLLFFNFLLFGKLLSLYLLLNLFRNNCREGI